LPRFIEEVLWLSFRWPCHPTHQHHLRAFDHIICKHQLALIQKVDHCDRFVLHEMRQNTSWLSRSTHECQSFDGIEWKQIQTVSCWRITRTNNWYVNALIFQIRS
jgi:hypothetical protein